jgi:hypothetical protein
MTARSLWLLSLLGTLGCHTERLVPAYDALEAIACTPGSLTLTRAPAEVLFMLDRSGSMATPFGTGTRWTSLTQTLNATLPAVDSTMAVGALFFPEQSSGQTCAVSSTGALEPAVGNVSALVARLAASSPGGATPTADALDAAAALMVARQTLGVAQALVLATDGAPDCNASLDAATCTCASNTSCRGSPQMCLDDTRTVGVLATVAATGLPTYVIGIQDSGDTLTSVLDAMAAAGGRPRTGAAHAFYAANSTSELSLALSTIRDEVGACVYFTSSVPDSGGTITVSLDGTALPSSGWAWANEALGELLLTGEACARAIAEASPTVPARVVPVDPSHAHPGVLLVTRASRPRAAARC